MRYKSIIDLKNPDRNNFVLLLDSLEFPDQEVTIPDDPANRHYAAYLAWVAEGNTAEPADE